MTALIAAALTVPLLIGLYFLKLRRRPMVVPSTLLWRKAVQDLQVNAPFQKLRNSLLLWLQLLLLLLLLFAMARPADDAAAVNGQRIAILIDHSASMLATDAAGADATRLEAAKRAARDVVANLERGAAAMVVSFAETPRVRQQFTTDRSALRRAIDTIAPTDQRGRLGPALRVLEPHANEDGSLSVVVVSDGRASDGADALPGLPGAAVRYLAVGSERPRNLAIVSSDARRDVDDPSEVEVFARLVNTGNESVTANVTLEVEGAVQATRRVEVRGTGTADDDGGAPRASGERVVSFRMRLPGQAAVTVSHDVEDHLTADNAARLMLTAARRLRVLVVTPGDNPFLAEAVSAAGVDTLDAVTPAAFDEQGMTGSGYDVVVFDRWTPEFLPPTNTLSFGAVPAVRGFALREAQADAPALQRPLTWAGNEPVMRYVALDDLVIREPGRLVLPRNGKVLATGLSGPLIGQVAVDAEGDTESSGRTRHVAVAFDVRGSRWPLSWSWQVFMVNALEVLGLGNTGDVATVAYRAGEAVTVPVEDGEDVTYRGPETLNAAARSGLATLPTLTRVGWYRTDADAVAPPMDRIAVNLLDENESDLRPAEVLRVASSSGVASAAGEETVRREWWPWLTGAALAMLCVEWWVYAGRVRV